MQPDFIVHAATAEGAGGIAVIELYGERAEGALAGLFRPRGGRMPREGEQRLGEIGTPGGEAIDEVLVASFPGEASWCRLGGWAISCHGGALVQRRLREALARAGGREEDRAGVLARARACGALDRLQAEALLLLPGARTLRAARYLLRLASGELSRRLAGLRRALGSEPAAARREVEDLLREAPRALHLLEPRRILFAGRPNAGKSSLFNRLAQRERAAVSAQAGTTRDLIEETVAIAGYPVVLVDSAGLRPEGEAADPVEAEGMRRARGSARGLVLFLIDRPGALGPDETEFLAPLRPEDLLVVRTKADLHPSAAGPEGAREAGWVSARTGAGLDALRERIREDWFGPPEAVELPPLPFTAAQSAALAAALATGRVDAVRAALLELSGARESVPGEPRG